VYFGWSLILGLSFTVFQAGVIALVLLYGAFISEIYRAALEAIPRGQREAGLALGMRPIRVFLQIVLPQATKIAIPNIGSMFIGMVKDTSTFTVIGLLAVAAVAAVTVGASATTKAGNPYNLKSPGTLVVGMNLQYKPEMYLDAKGKPAGYDVVLLNALTKAMKVKLQIKNLDFNGLI